MRVPEGQTSVFYDVEKTVEASKRGKRSKTAAESPPPRTRPLSRTKGKRAAQNNTLKKSSKLEESHQNVMLILIERVRSLKRIDWIDQSSRSLSSFLPQILRANTTLSLLQYDDTQSCERSSRFKRPSSKKRTRSHVGLIFFRTS